MQNFPGDFDFPKITASSSIPTTNQCIFIDLLYLLRLLGADYSNLFDFDSMLYSDSIYNNDNTFCYRFLFIYTYLLVLLFDQYYIFIQIKVFNSLGIIVIPNLLSILSFLQ